MLALKKYKQSLQRSLESGGNRSGEVADESQKAVKSDPVVRQLDHALCFEVSCPSAMLPSSSRANRNGASVACKRRLI